MHTAELRRGLHNSRRKKGLLPSRGTQSTTAVSIGVPLPAMGTRPPSRLAQRNLRMHSVLLLAQGECVAFFSVQLARAVEVVSGRLAPVGAG